MTTHGTSQNSDLEIKEIDEIIAIELLVANYSFDPIKYTKKEIEYMIELLQMALNSKMIT